MSPRSWEMCELLHTRAFILRQHRVGVKANSGHELGHLGLDDFMARRPGWERPISKGGAPWIHFGANIGAADCASWPRLNLAAPVRRRTWSLPRRLYPAVKPVTSIAPGEDTSPWSGAIRCSICRKTAGRMRSIRTR